MKDTIMENITARMETIINMNTTIDRKINNEKCGKEALIPLNNSNSQ